MCIPAVIKMVSGYWSNTPILALGTTKPFLCCGPFDFQLFPIRNNDDMRSFYTKPLCTSMVMFQDKFWEVGIPNHRVKTCFNFLLHIRLCCSPRSFYQFIFTLAGCNRAYFFYTLTKNNIILPFIISMPSSNAISLF